MEKLNRSNCSINRNRLLKRELLIHLNRVDSNIIHTDQSDRKTQGHVQKMTMDQKQALA